MFLKNLREDAETGHAPSLQFLNNGDFSNTDRTD